MNSNQNHGPSTTRILIIGKTGNGKSSLGNIILRQKKFAVGTGMACTTVSTARGSSVRNGRTIEVIDTPDLSNQYHTFAEIQEEVKKWRGRPETTPDLVLLAVRCDVRYTAEEFAIYQQVKEIWGRDLCRRLVVAFTFGDRQDRDIRQELWTVCHELKSVLKDASGRYVLFPGPASSENEKAVGKLMNIVDKLPQHPLWVVFEECVGVLLSFVYVLPRYIFLLVWLILQAVYTYVWGLFQARVRNPPYKPLK